MGILTYQKIWFKIGNLCCFFRLIFLFYVTNFQVLSDVIHLYQWFSAISCFPRQPIEPMSVKNLIRPFAHCEINKFSFENKEKFTNGIKLNKVLYRWQSIYYWQKMPPKCWKKMLLIRPILRNTYCFSIWTFGVFMLNLDVFRISD